MVLESECLKQYLPIHKNGQGKQTEEVQSLARWSFTSTGHLKSIVLTKISYSQNSWFHCDVM